MFRTRPRRATGARRTRPLTLRRHTLRALTPSELAEVGGGEPPTMSAVLPLPPLELAVDQ